ncbi:MAG: hypothetical protein ABWZ98_17575 [Nakamurella sp.]
MRSAAGILDWLLVVLVCLLAGWVAVVGFAFLPWYIGPVPVPVSVLLGVGAMILAPRACYALTHSLVAAALPVLTWFGVSVWITLSRNALMPTVSLTVINGQWRVMLLLGFGALAAAATIGLIWGDRLRDRIAGNQPGGQDRSDHPAAGQNSVEGKVTTIPGPAEFI